MTNPALGGNAPCCATCPGTSADEEDGDHQAGQGDRGDHAEARLHAEHEGLGDDAADRVGGARRQLREGRGGRVRPGEVAVQDGRLVGQRLEPASAASAASLSSERVVKIAVVNPSPIAPPAIWNM